MLGALILAGFATFVYSYFTRPPHLGAMHERELAGHERKVRRILEKSAAVFAGRNTGDGMEVWLFPLDNGAPFLFDVTAELDFSAPHNPYEPSFTYWRKDFDRGIGIDWLQNFIDVANILTSREEIYAESREVAGKRFIIGLDDFAIYEGSKFGLADDPGVPAHRFHAMSDPLGKTLFVVRNYNMVIDELMFGEITNFSSGGTGELPILSSISREASGYLRSETEYDFFTDPIPAEDGVYLSRYLLSRDAGDEMDTVKDSGIVKLIPAGDGYIEEVFTIRNPKRQKRDSLGVRNFSHLYYADLENKLFGFLVDESGERRRFVLSAYDVATGEFLQMNNFNRPFRQVLVDYDERIAFFTSSDVPKPPDRVDNSEFAERRRDDGSIRYSYYLCSMDLRSLEVKVLREFDAGNVPAPGGRIVAGAPVISLCESEKLVVASNGEVIFTLDYGGGGYREIATGGKIGWNLIYVASKVEPRRSRN